MQLAQIELILFKKGSGFLEAYFIRIVSKLSAGVIRANLCTCVCIYVCPDLCDEHARGHGEACAWGEVTGDHDPHASLGERELVRVRGQQLIDHQHRRFPVEISCTGGTEERTTL